MIFFVNLWFVFLAQKQLILAITYLQTIGLNLDNGCGNLILESLVDNFEDWSKMTNQNFILENDLVSNPGALCTGRVWSIARSAVQCVQR